AERRDNAEPWREGGGGEAPDLDQFVAARQSLAEHLAEQVGLILADPAERLIGQALIDSLNEAGYLTSALSGLAEQLGTEEARIAAVLAKVQGCDPIGVFARDLRECL